MVDTAGEWGGLRMYETEKADTTSPELWKGAGTTNIKTAGKGVLTAAFSTTGEQIAAVSNLKTDGFEVYIGDAGRSGGTCHGGPPGGKWFPEYALGLAKRASWK